MDEREGRRIDAWVDDQYAVRRPRPLSEADKAFIMRALGPAARRAASARGRAPTKEAIVRKPTSRGTRPAV